MRLAGLLPRLTPLHLDRTRLAAPVPPHLPPTPTAAAAAVPHARRLRSLPCGPLCLQAARGMGRELGPHPEVARLRTTPGPPALKKLSVTSSSGVSPGTSPRSVSARQAGMSRSRSSGGALGPSVEALQQAAAGAGAGGAAAAAQGEPGSPGGQPSPAQQQQQQQAGAGSSSASPNLPSTLAALHALNPPTANGAAHAAAAAGAQQGGKQPSKQSGFFGMFHRTPKNGGRSGQSDAASDDASPSRAGEGKHKKSSSWFGFGGGKKRSGSASLLASPNGAAPLSAGGRTGSGCLVLPGLPLAEVPGRPASRPGSRAGSSTGGSEVAAPGSAAGTPGAVVGLRSAQAAGYAGDVSASDASGKHATRLCCYCRVCRSIMTGSLASRLNTDVHPSHQQRPLQPNFAHRLPLLSAAPSSAQPSPAVAAGLPPGIGPDPGTAQRKSHRRHRSLTSLLLKPGWRRRHNSQSGGWANPVLAGCGCGWHWMMPVRRGSLLCHKGVQHPAICFQHACTC